MPHMLGLFCEKNMPIQQISLGARPKGEGGDTWREGSEKINGNFQNLDERTTLAQNTADSKTTNETDEFLLSRENHTGSQPMSTVTGLQDALDSVSDAVNNVNDAVIAVDIIAKVAIPSNQKGIANGVATLDSAGIIPANQLPSYVDDVLEFATLANFPSVGEAGKIYIAIETSKAYRWTGTVYVAIGGAEAADTALRLFTARTISISDGATGTATQFDGSANITIPITEIDATKITKGLIPSARIPTLNQSTTGNAATATKLATPRKINGVSFDGTGDINLDVYNKSEVDTAIANATPTIPNATETVAGKAKIATTAIAQAGTNDADFLTAKKLRDALNASGEAPISACRAMVCFNGKASPPVILSSLNISSVVKNATGDYTLNFTTPLGNSNYAVSCGGATGGSASKFYPCVKAVGNGDVPVLKTPTQLRIACVTAAASAALLDMSEIYIEVFC